MAKPWDIKLVLLGLATLLLSACADRQVSQVPLPWDFPLMPGDAALWETLTVEEQRRALAFLSDGSTIRSSLVEGY
ncbi:hypothetical protein [Pseudophaeobacter sp.]|jgi:hypothetical protein|uniref:hypothetical protein n=1 Tax=unclassified Pseudophaeobacter TaxID=2637024 RepID=UPI0021FB3DA9|nr:hypothetical protein N1037_04415 [Phaeobacter sp. G2]